MSRYDIEKFDPPPDPDLVCCICQCVLDKAVESPCRHVFCQACIERWLTNRHTCPTCRKRTRKQDLKPVLPLVQNVLNRLMMKCDYRENGCTEKIVLEQFEKHVQSCGYEMKMCRFSKCGQKILKMSLSQHERSVCEHRETVCDGECGLMIPLSDKCTHNCVAALKAHIEEKNRMIETLKTKLQELNNLSQSLNDQLEQLRQQLDEHPRFPSISSFSGSDTDVTDFMSETLSDESLFDETSNQSAQNLDNNNEGDPENIPENTASDVVEQVERTIVTTLFDVSSRLEVVRNQMRAVLDAGFVNDNDNLHIVTPALDAIVHNNSTVGVSSSANTSFANTVDNRNRDGANSLNSHRIMQTLHSLISSAPDNADHSSEAQDGDVLPEFQNRSLDDTADTNSVYHDSRDVSYSDQYENSDQNNSDSNLSYIDGNSDDNGDSEEEEEDHNRSFRFSSHNHSSTDHNSLEERSLPGHVIVSEPPGSPSNTNSSFLSSSSSIPTTSSVGDSPASHLAELPANASTPRNDSADEDNWASDANIHTPHSMASSHGDDTNCTSPRSHQSTPNSSQRSACSDDIETQNTGPEYDSDSSIGSVSHRSSSVASRNSISEHSDDSVHSVSSSSTVAQTLSDESHSEDQEEGHSDENSPVDNSDRSGEENSATEDEKWYRHRGHTNETTDEYEEQNDTTPSAVIAGATNGENAMDNSNKLSGDHPEGTSNASLNEKKDNMSEFQDPTSHAASSSTSTDELYHVVIPSDSSDDSDKSESMKYLTKRLRRGKKETETSAEAKNGTNTVMNENGKNVKCAISKIDEKFASEVNNEKYKVDNSVRGRHGRKRRGTADVSYQGSQCKKTNSGSNSYGSVFQSQLQQSSLPSQTVTNVDQRQPVRRTRSSTIQASATTPDNNSQSLNVKIDLSLINYSGQMGPQSVSGSTPSATVMLSKTTGTKQENSGVGDWTATTQGHRSGSPRGNDIIQNNTHRPSRYPRRRENWTRSQTHSSSPARHSAVHSYNTRTFPHSWIDESDHSESSDDTYVPGSDCNETDVTITEEEAESDTSYEVQIPKTTVDLLEEYGSNDSDESWTVGMG